MVGCGWLPVGGSVARWLLVGVAAIVGDVYFVVVVVAFVCVAAAVVVPAVVVCVAVEVVVVVVFVRAAAAVVGPGLGKWRVECRARAETNEWGVLR